MCSSSSGRAERKGFILGFFEQIEKATQQWDGDEPHRIVG